MIWDGEVDVMVGWAMARVSFLGDIVTNPIILDNDYDYYEKDQDDHDDVV